jgi:hypothetical protein
VATEFIGLLNSATRSDRYRDGVRHGDDPGRVGAVKRGQASDALALTLMQTVAPEEVRRLRRVCHGVGMLPTRPFRANVRVAPNAGGKIR